MKNISKATAFLMAASITFYGAATFAHAAEDIPPAGYQANDTVPAAEDITPAEEVAPRIFSIQDYQDMNDELAEEGSDHDITRSPAMGSNRTGGVVVADGEVIDLDEIANEEVMVESNNVPVATTRSDDAAADDDEAADEEGTQDIEPISGETGNPETGHVNAVIPMLAAMAAICAPLALRRK